MTTRTHHIIMALPIAAMLLAGCQGEEACAPAVPSCDKILLGTTLKGVAMEWLPEVQSRSSIAAPVATVPDDIGVWGFNDATSVISTGFGLVFDNQRMMYKDGTSYNEFIASPNNSSEAIATISGWEYKNHDGSDNLWPYFPTKSWMTQWESRAVKYKFYSYSPYTPGDGTSLGNMYVPVASYDGFSLMYWRGLQKFSPIDYVIANKVLQYTAQASDNPEQEMTMQHLYARLRFCFRLHDKFGDRRWIRVKSMEITNLWGITLQAKVDFVLDGTSNEYLPSVTYSTNDISTFDRVKLTNEPEAQDGIDIKKSNNGSYQPLASLYLFPEANYKDMKVAITYDVYDNEDQLLRLDDKSSNTLTLDLVGQNETATGTQRQLLPGHYYDIKITVNPKFLYVLDDNDFDADGEIRVND